MSRAGTGEQKAAEADVAGFKEDLGPFVVAVETTRMPMVFTNARASDNPVIFVNQAFLTMTGFDEDEVLGRTFGSLMEPEAIRKPSQKSRRLSRAVVIYRRKSDAGERTRACSGSRTS